jgi:RNA polymerase sigma-70 factor (ECF subfamily)
LEPLTVQEAPSFTDLLRSEIAFQAWYERALPRVYGYVYRRCGSSDLAEDVTQQAFLDAVRRPTQFRADADPVTWVCAIARNRLADHFRRQDREARRRLRVREIAVDPDVAEWAGHDRRDAIERALRSLPPLQRGAFVYRYLDDLSVREVGRLIGKSEKATESLLARAKDNFRRSYGEANDG